MKPHKAPQDREHILKAYDKQPFDKIWALLRPYRPMLFGSMITLILFNIVGLSMPWMLKITIDRILPNADIVLYCIVACVMVLLYLMRSLLRYIACYTLDYMGVRLMIELRQKVFTHLQQLSLRFYEEYRTGKLISNVISDVAMLQVLLRTFTSLGEQLFMLFLIAGLLVMINTKLGLLVLCTIPLHYINFSYFRREMRKDSMVIQEKMSEISANLSETLSGVKVVKSFAKERHECLNFFQNLRPLADMQMRLTVDAMGLWAIYDMLSLLTHLAIIGMGIWYIQINAISIGEFVAFYTYVNMLLTPINALSNMSITISQGMVGASRIVKLLNTIPEVKEAPNALCVNKLSGKIEFKNVVFSYEPEKGNTVDDFSLTISPGEKVALVGPRVPASPPSAICCCAFMMFPAAVSGWMVTMYASCSCSLSGKISVWCCRNPFSFPVRSATTSPMRSSGRSAKRRSLPLPVWRMWMSLFNNCRMVTTPSSVKTVPRFPAVRNSGSPSPVPC